MFEYFASVVGERLAHGYDPHSDEHSTFLTSLALQELRRYCPTLNGMQAWIRFVDRGPASYHSGHKPKHDGGIWLIDPRNRHHTGLEETSPEEQGGRLALVFEHKLVLSKTSGNETAHWNAMVGFADTVHRIDPGTIAAFTLIVNTNPRTGAGASAGIEALLRKFTSVADLRTGTQGDKARCDAILVLPVWFDGTNTHLDLNYASAPSSRSTRGRCGFMPFLCQLICERTPDGVKGPPYALEYWPPC
jgi:hypothetical protein